MREPATVWRQETQRWLMLVVAACGLLTVVALVSCGGNKPKASLSAEDAFARAMDLYGRGKWEKAGIEFESFTFSYPGAARIDSAQFLLATCYYNMKDYIRAEDEFRRLRRQYPTSPLVVDAELQRAHALLNIAPDNAALDQKRTADAITQLKYFKDSYPLAPQVRVADSLLDVAYSRMSERDFKAGKLYYRMGRHQAARIMFQEMIDLYPESPLVPEAVYHIAEGYQAQDSLDRAIEYYEKLIYLYPEHDRTVRAKKRVGDLNRRREELRALENSP